MGLAELLSRVGDQRTPSAESMRHAWPRYEPSRDAYAGLKTEIAGTIGDLMRFWGFGRNLGRIWTWLYLTPQPINASDMQTALQLSAGSVSTAIRELRRWGVIKPVHLAGERAEHFSAETRLLPVIKKVFREREMAVIERAQRAMRQARDQMRIARLDADDRKMARFIERRLDRLIVLTQLGRGLLDWILRKRSSEMEAINDAFELG